MSRRGNNNSMIIVLDSCGCVLCANVYFLCYLVINLFSLYVNMKCLTYGARPLVHFPMEWSSTTSLGLVWWIEKWRGHGRGIS
jgi:hypothetical protein